MKYVAPTFGTASFTCPHCSANAHQDWFTLLGRQRKLVGQPGNFAPHGLDSLMELEPGAAPAIHPLPPLRPANESADKHLVTAVAIARCFSCEGLSLWTSRNLAWPAGQRTHLPNEDLPAEVRRDFQEADAIFATSPRGAAALLRLALQKLCDAIEPGHRSINDAIGALVKKGLRVEVQRALDIVRVVGNNAVHPGQLDLKDDAATASQLFNLVNLIADAMISQPRKIEELYQGLPQGALDGITKRDDSGT